VDDPGLTLKHRFTASEKCGALRKFSWIEMTVRDALEYLSSIRQLPALAVLAAGKLDSGPHAVFLARFDRLTSA
jgi:hypothetical protein